MEIQSVLDLLLMCVPGCNVPLPRLFRELGMEANIWSPPIQNGHKFSRSDRFVKAMAPNCMQSKVPRIRLGWHVDVAA